MPGGVLNPALRISVPPSHDADLRRNLQQAHDLAQGHGPSRLEHTAEPDPARAVSRPDGYAPDVHPPVCIVIPTYNEAANVEGIVRAAVAELERLVPDAHRVLIVDANSPDGTGAIADRLARAGARVVIADGRRDRPVARALDGEGTIVEE